VRILGLSAFSRSAAAALVEEGQVRAAVREDRLARTTDDTLWPLRALNSCLQVAEVTLADVDLVVFHEKPFLKFARLVRDSLATWPASRQATLGTLPAWLEDGLVPNLVLERETGIASHCVFLKQHLAHAASAFLVSPFEEAAILCLDGAGEEASASWGIGQGNRVHLRQEQRFPNSLGFLVQAVASYLGLPRRGGEEVLVDLSRAGAPSHLEGLRRLVNVQEDGSLQVDQTHLPFRAGGRLYSSAFVRTFGPPRPTDQVFEPRHLDMAASLQALLEEVTLVMARHVARQTGSKNLCLAGGVARNSALGTRILEEGVFDDCFIPPAPGTDGAALGAALAVGCARGASRPAPLQDPFLGPSWTAAHVRRVLTNAGRTFREPAPACLPDTLARLLEEHGALGWLEGRVEFSSQALGSRGILVDPSRPEILDRVQRRLGSCRPVAGAGLALPEDRPGDWFELDRPSPFGMLSPNPRGPTRDRCRALLAGQARVPVTTINPRLRPVLAETLESLGRNRGCPIAALLPLQRHGEPLACRPEEALEICHRAGLTCLMAEGLLAELPDLPPASPAPQDGAHEH